MKLCSKKTHSCFKIDSFSHYNRENIKEFLMKTFPHMKKTIPFWDEYIRYHGKNIIIKNKEEKMIGFANIEPKRKGKEIYVNFFSIDPIFQNNGLGTTFLSFIEKEGCKNKKTKYLSLHTEMNKEKNVYFYLKNGWDIHFIDFNGYTHTPSVEFRKKC